MDCWTIAFMLLEQLWKPLNPSMDTMDRVRVQMEQIFLALMDRVTNPRYPTHRVGHMMWNTPLPDQPAQDKQPHPHQSTDQHSLTLTVH